MAGAFSGHLLNSWEATRKQVPFTQQSSGLSINGPMSFNPSMHGFTPSFGGGTAPPSYSFSMDVSEESAVKIATLQAKLNKKLGPEYISQRPGPSGGPKLTYAEGWKIINLANEVFGFNGWSSTVVNLTTDFIDYNEESRRYNVGVSAIVRVTLRDGVFHEDVGCGLLENSKTKGGALDKCKKEAVTDALKRTLRNFGNVLGNCLYDKAYTQEVVKIKVPPAKFDKSDLYRRPEFEETKPSVPQSHAAQAPAPSASAAPTKATPSHASSVKAEPQSDAITRSRPLAPPARQADASNRPQNGLPPPPPPESRPSPPVRAQPANIPNNLRNSVSNNHVPPAQQASTSKAPSAPASVQHRHPVAPEPDDDPDIDIPSVFEESFGLNSDEDAFYATVDLGDDDLGQPIVVDDDGGRPIDFEEGLRFDEENTESMDMSTNTSMHAKAPVRAAQQRSYETNSNGRNLGGPSRPNGANANASLDTGKNGSGEGNQNLSRKTSTSSMGGFNFPPGMTAADFTRPSQHDYNIPAAPLPPPQHHQHPNNLKRSSDIMRAPPPGQRGPGPGMGLVNPSSSSSRSSRQQAGQAVRASSSTGGTGAPRQPLGNLDVDEGGAIKRVKR